MPGKETFFVELISMLFSVLKSVKVTCLPLRFDFADGDAEIFLLGTRKLDKLLNNLCAFNCRCCLGVI